MPLMQVQSSEEMALAMAEERHELESALAVAKAEKKSLDGELSEVNVKLCQEISLRENLEDEVASKVCAHFRTSAQAPCAVRCEECFSMSLDSMQVDQMSAEIEVKTRSIEAVQKAHAESKEKMELEAGQAQDKLCELEEARSVLAEEKEALEKASEAKNQEVAELSNRMALLLGEKEALLQSLGQIQNEKVPVSA